MMFSFEYRVRKVLHIRWLGILVLWPVLLFAEQQDIGTDQLIVRYAGPALSVMNRSVETLLPQNHGTNARLLASARALRTTALGASVVKLFKRLAVPEAKELCRELEQQPGILSAEPDYILQHQSQLPNAVSQQWHYGPEWENGISPFFGWHIAQQGQGVPVAVIDTGVIPHQDLVAILLPGHDFIRNPPGVQGISETAGENVYSQTRQNNYFNSAYDPGDGALAGACGEDRQGWPIPREDRPSSWHGTHVAGIIGAAGDGRGNGIAGVGWGSRILPVRVLGACGGYTSDVTDAMLWSVGLPVADLPGSTIPAGIINLGLAGAGICSRTFAEAIDKVREKGAVVVAAAGNQSQDASLVIPAACDGVITVAAMEKRTTLIRASYSNFGKVVDLSAPVGDRPTEGIYSTSNEGTLRPGLDSYADRKGTSMAAAEVSGVLALMKSVNTTLTPDEQTSILIGSVEPFLEGPTYYLNQCRAGVCGAGRLVADKAVNAAFEAYTGFGDILRKGTQKRDIVASAAFPRYFTFELAEPVSNLTVSLLDRGTMFLPEVHVRHGQRPTRNDYDCYTLRNQPQCRFDVADAGVWHVKVAGYGGRYVSGVSLLVDYDGEEQTSPLTLGNRVRMVIPGRNPRGVIGSLYVPDGVSGVPELELDITHPLKGDLRVILVSPDGQSWRVNDAGWQDDGANLHYAGTVALHPETARGVWKLHVASPFGVDGVLNRWQLTFP